MTERLELWRPSQRNIATTTVNVDIDTSTIVSGSNLDTFLLVPQDLEYDDGYFFFDVETQPGVWGGILSLFLMQLKDARNPNEGPAYQEVTASQRITRPVTQQTKMRGALRGLVPELPVYLRIRGRPKNSTVFWTGAGRPSRLRATINFLRR